METQNKKLKIAFLSSYSPDDRKASSGTNYKMAEKLSEIGELEWVPIQVTRIGNILFKLVRRWNKYFPKKINLGGTVIGSKLIYKSFGNNAFDNYNVVAAFFCMPALAHLKTKTPIIYFSDATFPAMVNYYPEFSNLFKFNIRQGIKLEKSAMDKASKVILSSDWAKKSAINDLKQNPEKIEVIEFGANIDEKDIRKVIPEFKEPLEILFLGVNWERKGGQIAVDAVKWLNENGITANLNIIGIRNLDESISSLPYIKNHGFLNKNVLEDYQKLNKILSQANIMLLPTKAECSAIAFSEASANGMPIFSHLTGGVSNYVIDGENGYLLPLGSTGEDFGRKIKEVYESSELRVLSEKAVTIYDEKLNWNSWGSKVAVIMSDLLKYFDTEYFLNMKCIGVRNRH